MANTFKDIHIKYLSDDEVLQRNYIKCKSIRKIRINNLLLEEANTELQIAISNYKGGK